MTGVMVRQGREGSGADLGLIRSLLAEQPAWGRTRLSEALCRRLPPRRGPSSNGSRNRHVPIVAPATDPIRCARRNLRPLTVTVVAPRSEDLRLLNGLLAGDHDLGHRHTVGETLRFIPDVRRAWCA